MTREFDDLVVQRFRTMLEDAAPSDADLVDQAAEAAVNAETARRIDTLFKAAVEARMLAIGASMLLGNDAKAERSVAGHYEWDPAAVARCVDGALGENASYSEGYLTGRVVPATVDYSFNTAKLKALAKKMGSDFEKQLMAAATVTPGTPRITYSEKRKTT